MPHSKQFDIPGTAPTTCKPIINCVVILNICVAQHRKKQYQTMSIRTKKEILIGTVAELVQNLLPTQILCTLDTFDINNEESQPTANDLEDEKFIQELLLANRKPSTASHYPDEILDHNRSLTYYDIIEEEMLSSLTVSKHNIQVSLVGLL